MSFQFRPLSAETFVELGTLSDDALRARRARRVVVDAAPGYPCRVTLADAEIGETVLLLHYEHQPADSPFRSSHAIYVRPGRPAARPRRDEIPDFLRGRLLSVRAFDANDEIVNADVVEGMDLEPVLTAMLESERTRYLHVHNAKLGCYLARVERG